MHITYFFYVQHICAYLFLDFRFSSLTVRWDLLSPWLLLLSTLLSPLILSSPELL